MIAHVDEVREPTYLVLTALAGGPLHGYGIIQEAETLSKGRVRLRAGTLYPTLDRLEGNGLVEATGEEVVDGRRRRYYRLTERGTATLAAESAQRMAVSKEAVRRLRTLGAWT